MNIVVMMYMGCLICCVLCVVIFHYIHKNTITQINPYHIHMNCDTDDTEVKHKAQLNLEKRSAEIKKQDEKTKSSWVKRERESPSMEVEMPDVDNFMEVIKNNHSNIVTHTPHHSYCSGSKSSSHSCGGSSYDSGSSSSYDSGSSGGDGGGGGGD